MPLRFPRPAMVGVAIVLASASIVLGSVPALADAVRQQEWWLGKLGVTSAWQTSRGSGITVAVLGDGTESSNPDLVGSVITGPDLIGSGRTTAGPYFGLTGTPVASLIAGHGHGTDASEGIIGVAPAAKILSVRVNLSPGDPLSTSAAVTARLPGAIAAGIRYAVRHGARVIDLPIDPGQPGASGTPGASAPAGGSAAERAAVSYALRKGVVLVAPAGDNGAGSDAVSYPAAYPGVISAGAFDRNLMKSAYSSHQSYVTLTAPGQGVIAATAPGSYAAMNSTSAASAIVAGIAALIRSRFPVLSPALVYRALIHSTLFRRPGGIKDGSGYGTANAARALERAAAIAAPLATPGAAQPGASQPGASQPATRQPPTPPAVPSATSSLVSKVLKAVVISAGVLILLLLPITAYAAVGRRRARRAAQARWERDQAAETGPGYAGAATPDRLDPMLEYFSPAAEPPAALFPAAPGARPPGGGSPPGAPNRAGHGRQSTAGISPGSGAGSRFPAADDPFRHAEDPFRAPGDPARALGNPARAPGDPFAAAEDPFAAAGDPFQYAGDPFGAPDPSGASEDPFAAAAAGDPFGPARNPFAPAGDSPRTTGEPAIGAAGDRPGPAGRTRAGNHSRSGAQAATPALGPAPRSAGRQPRPSGTPPWEPAAKPDSELPWADDPAPRRAYPAPVQPTHPARAAHRRMQKPAPSASGSPWPDAPAPVQAASPDAAAGSIWDAAARTARRQDTHDTGRHDGGRRGAGRHNAGRDEANGASQGGASSPEPGSEDPGTGPIYVWNPGASTETFPSVPVQPDPSAPGQPGQ